MIDNPIQNQNYKSKLSDKKQHCRDRFEKIVEILSHNDSLHVKSYQDFQDSSDASLDLDQDIKKSVNITKKLRASVETQVTDCCDLQADKQY